tara:strand:- start:644 stop:1030 length:387 start_codon:yes stop_codon:yes gene_type:complete
MSTGISTNIANNTEICNICGDYLNNKLIYTTKCNHVFHYECLQKSLQNSFDKHNSCPLCRQNIDLLPVVNGLKKLIRGIHYTSIEYKNSLNYINTPCNHVLKSGKNKGQVCNRNCKIGYNVCSKHFKK